MTVTKQIFSGVAVILLTGLIMGSVDVYSSVRTNTEHRLDSKEDEIYSILLRVEANQKFLMKKYDAEVSG